MNDLLSGPFTLKFAREHLLPDETIVTNDDETYYIIRLGDYGELEREGYRKVK
ncbi:hypothetical protein LCL96_12550 [Rossellomorea aquimaris]|uniref:hypothetical protein n=1 Tax=Rossellomorea aquimaris TaxID=189382 RepID=UPI001CD3122C|nr:hypothetical protein [Rossellomorea aquimaris]MCA1059778.1 hypothetical protein [Rossellomorea aquimaris]